MLRTVYVPLRECIAGTDSDECIKNTRVKTIFQGPTCHQSVFMQNFKFGAVMVLAVQLFNKIKKTKNFKNYVSLYFHMLCQNTFIFW